MGITISKKVLYRETLDYIMIAIGCISYSIGWTIFLLPNDISTGGVAGLSSIVYWAFNIKVSYTYFSLNALLLVVALKTLGWRFCVKTIYGVIVMTISVGLLREYVPDPTIMKGEPFMAALIGSLFCGTGLGFCLSYNGSSGGSDIVAAIVNKYRDISLGRVLVLVDTSIVTLSYVVLKDWERVIYGYLSLVIVSFVLDQVVNSGRRSVQFLIISERYNEICKQVTETPPHRGCTIIDAHGYYSGQTTKVVLVVTRQREARVLYHLINDIDPQAFVTQSQVMGVFGQGFDKFKIKSKNNNKKSNEATGLKTE
ncbi:YitT family protein [Prevotella aurantiaca]|uniref:YitT family protein n=1 Tax=Prevotella aurantiaca TaxID=596085 RepID=UPI001CB556D2|nr:YitT family protein [Prevotella aurantiaca]MBF1386840.1 YitT family protein [Prevotella aurantiaca]